MKQPLLPLRWSATTAIAIGPADAGELEQLGAYGISKVLHCNDCDFPPTLF